MAISIIYLFSSLAKYISIKIFVYGNERKKTVTQIDWFLMEILRWIHYTHTHLPSNRNSNRELKALNVFERRIHRKMWIKWKFDIKQILKQMIYLLIWPTAAFIFLFFFRYSISISPVRPFTKQRRRRKTLFVLNSLRASTQTHLIAY